MKRYSFDSVIFDLDGVVTQTALVHAQAWKEAFDAYLRLREKRDAEPFREFTHEGDYLPYVDGKPRYEGVKSFLESRGIAIAYGDPSDTSDKETICGIGNSKNEQFRKVLKEQGAQVFSSTIDFIKILKSAGIHVGVASSSKNCQPILQAAGIEELFETRIDGVVSAELGLKGKPEGDIFIKAAENVGSSPAVSVVVEDAVSGVQAGRNGSFGFVLGVARENNEAELLANGADCVVRDLADITIDDVEKWFQKQPVALIESWDKLHNSIRQKLGNGIMINPLYERSSKEVLFNGKRLVFFLDYDGTLTPIVDRPDMAIMSKQMREIVTQLSKMHTVAIVSGRMREDVENLVKIDGIFYAGSHGFDIKGPGFSLVQPKAQEVIPVVSSIIEGLKKELQDIPGVIIEEKKFSTAVHYRLVKDKSHMPRIEKAVNQIVENEDSVRLMSGKMVFEILPNIEWNKGMAIRWIMNALKIQWDEARVVYIGDDVTDEFAFRAVRSRGTGILVSEKLRVSSADFHLHAPKDVQVLFEKVISASSRG